MNRAVLLVCVAACGGDSTGVTVTMTATDDAPAYGDTPFPTDAVREGDRLGMLTGLEAIASRRLELVTAHVAALDGFGLRPLVEFFVDGDLDPAAIPTATTTLDAPAAVVDVDPASPEHGRVIAMDWRYFPERGVVAGSATSGAILREGTRYAAVVTTAIGAGRSAALAGLAKHERWRTTADALAELDPQTTAPIAGIAVFTTQHASAPLVAAREAMVALPAPVLAFPDPTIVFSGTTRLDRILGQASRATDGPRTGLERWGNDNPTGMAHDHVGVIGSGTITITRFRGDDTGTDLPGDETFELDGAGVPKLFAIDTIPITFILPAAAPPAAGYPIVIYGHGLGASRDQLLSFAEPLTSQGYALVGIDMAGHGSRFDPQDLAANMASQLPMFSGVPATPDGFGDTTGQTTQFEFFEGFLSVSAVRDSMRQSALDLSRVVQLVKQPGLDLSPLGATAKLDSRRVVYLAESFGTVVGTLFAAIEPDVDLFVLDVPGGGILDLILPASPEIAQIAVPFVETLYNPATRLDRWNPLISLMQAVIDGGDPLTYAPHVLRDRFTIGGAVLAPRNVIAIEVVGDQVLSNLGTDALASELGLHALAPHLDVPAGMPSIDAPAAANLDGQTAVLVQYAPATHGANWSAEHGTLRFAPGFPIDGAEPFPRLPTDITIANPIYETLDQVFEILASHRRGEPPRVIVTKAPTRDFDADGVVDTDDSAPLDPSRP
ncbi:MAG: hypothetical protein ABI867_29280 [Kofleriaceae bacterium]